MRAIIPKNGTKSDVGRTRVIYVSGCSCPRRYRNDPRRMQFSADQFHALTLSDYEEAQRREKEGK